MSTATRYADNTSVKPVNRVRVFGYAPGIFMKMPCAGSNQPEEVIDQGALILFKPHVFRQENIYSPKDSTTLEISGQEFADTVSGRFQYGPNGDLGYRTLGMLTELPYDKETGYDEADAYFDTVHPPLYETGLTCEMGLEVEKNHNCPTCRVKWLESKECEDRILASGLDYAIADALRKTLIDSNKAGLAFVRSKLNATDSDIAQAKAGKPGKGGYDEIDFHYAKMLHKKDAVTEQAELVTKQAKVQADALAQSLAGIFADKGKDEKIAALEAKLAALEAQEEEVKKPRGNPNWVKKDK
jgi:hypothetical protein